MAGAGYKLFVDGDILTASEVNTYLMQQSVMVFATAAARTSAIAAPSEGMVTYRTDNNVIEYYDGAAWQPILDQDVIAAKGDLIVGTGDDTVSRLAVGTNNYILTADSSTATGLKWAAAAGNIPNNGTAVVATEESTTSTSFTDLSTAGPAVTVTTGTRALVLWGSRIFNNTSGQDSFTSVEISGASSVAASLDYSAALRATGTSTPRANFNRAWLFTGLTAGSNTFTMKYRVGGGTGTFEARNIIVVDMGS